jgi:formylmethanofuran dehydrogenase subunit E
MAGKYHCSFAELEARMDSCGVSPQMKEYILATSAMHTHPAPGVLIGAFMVDYALELLGATPEDKLYAVCETPKCLPDALQAIAHCTTGNNRLRIVPIGKFAITVNGVSEGPKAEAVRVYIDLKKLGKFKIFDIWYANSPAFDKPTMSGKLQEEIFRAGREVLSFEWVQVEVESKRKWKSITCPGCGDTIPDYLIEGDRCGACGSMKYYEMVPEN